MADALKVNNQLVAVLDMGASAIRLVVAEIAPHHPVRIIEEASRGVLLGRDTFSAGVIRSETVDAALAALEGFREMHRRLRRPAGARRRDQRGPRGAQRRHVPRPDPRPHRHRRSRSSTKPKRAGSSSSPSRQALGRHRAFRGSRTLLAEVGGGSTSLTLLRRGAAEPIGRLRARRRPAAPAAEPAAPHPRPAARRC